MEQARMQVWIAAEKRIADTVRAQYPTATRIVLVQPDSDVTDLQEAIVYTNGTDDDPDGVELGVIEYSTTDPMYTSLDDTFRMLRDLGWEAENDRYSGEHEVVFSDADKAFEPVRPLVPQPGSNLSRTVYQIEVLHNTDDETALDPNVNTIGYWIREGHASGVISTASTIEVGDDDMGRLLTAQGSDPEFLFDYRD